jgi:hypothetical protein
MWTMPVVVITLPTGVASNAPDGCAESLWEKAGRGSKPLVTTQRPANSRAIARAFMASSTAKPEEAYG